MNNNNIVKIGVALKWRGTYSDAATYYMDNIVTLGGSVFRCKVLKTIGHTPLGPIDEEGHVSFANEDIWDVIVDLREYYNKMLDSNSLSKETQEYIKQVQDECNKQHEEIKTKLKNELGLAEFASINTVTGTLNTESEYDKEWTADMVIYDSDKNAFILVVSSDGKDDEAFAKWTDSGAYGEVGDDSFIHPIAHRLYVCRKNRKLYEWDGSNFIEVSPTESMSDEEIDKICSDGLKSIL